MLHGVYLKQNKNLIERILSKESKGEKIERHFHIEHVVDTAEHSFNNDFYIRRKNL